MTKIVLNDVTNLNTLSVINDNFDKIEQELQNKVFYRNNPTGEPNGLANDVDANGNSLYNVQDLTIDGAFTVQGQDVGAYIGQAAVSATDAHNSAVAAATSSSNAQSSADSALASKNTATAQATIATTKASEASTSASNAAASASTATTQAGVATTQAGIATTGAGTATTQAGNAATSASNAAASATTATTQAGIATTQATASASSATSAAASAAAAATALDNFDDRYLGPKASAPTLDNDGMALLTGALYYNDGTIVSTDKGMWVYDGGNWIKTSSASQAILVTYKYIATAGQTNFSGVDANGLTLSYTAGSIIPTLNGSAIDKTDYTATTGALFTLATAAAAGDEIVINAFTTFNLANVYTKGEADVLLAGKLATTAGAVTDTNLSTSGVTAGTYGDSSNIPSVTVNNKGRVTSASQIPFSNAYIGSRGQVFTTSGTFTVPAGVTALKVYAIGGGGAGGGGTGPVAHGGGGGGAGVGFTYLTGLTPGASITVTIGAGGAGGTGNGGAGGTTSFGAYCSATGGGGGGSALGNNTTNAGGAGGSTSGMSFSSNGYAGGAGYYVSCCAGTTVYSGGGGSNVFPFIFPMTPGGGFSGWGVNSNGNAGSGYGAGGGGAIRTSTAGAVNGGNGAAGCVIVEW